MPKVSKITKAVKQPKSNPGAAAPLRETPDKYYCTRCPRNFTKQKGNFPTSQSPIYRENGGYLPICRHCIDEMYLHYKTVLGDEKAAIRRICMKFDIYWHEKVYEMVYKGNTTNSRVLTYISKTNLYKYVGKTYDDTLDEEGLPMRLSDAADTVETIVDTGDEVLIPSEVIEFWGEGFPRPFYIDLERRLKYWCGDTDRYSMDVSECAIIRQICMLEVTITRDTAMGKSTDKSVNALNTLLGSANLKPVQKKKEESLDAAAEGTPFGVWIRKIENTRPISAPDPQMRDVDGIGKYISVWFLGHLCKMMKIDNTYSRLYEEEMARLRVERPEYEGEDEEAIFEDIFARAGDGTVDLDGEIYGE